MICGYTLETIAIAIKKEEAKLDASWERLKKRRIYPGILNPMNLSITKHFEEEREGIIYQIMRLEKVQEALKNESPESKANIKGKIIINGVSQEWTKVIDMNK